MFSHRQRLTVQNHFRRICVKSFSSFYFLLLSCRLVLLAFVVCDKRTIPYHTIPYSLFCFFDSFVPGTIVQEKGNTLWGCGYSHKKLQQRKQRNDDDGSRRLSSLRLSLLLSQSLGHALHCRTIIIIIAMTAKMETKRTWKTRTRGP